MHEEMNKVICIGGNHHNGLNLARIFGVNNIKPYAIIVDTNKKRPYMSKSKFWEKYWVVEDDDKAIDLLLKEFEKEKFKPVIIPYSDSAAEAVDRNLDLLKEKFLTPSINETQGEICKCMDKKTQYELAEKYGFPMAKTWEYFFNDPIPEDIIFPCILKPVASFEGSKLDIVKCENINELTANLEDLKNNKNYRRILIQEFLNIDFELLYMGGIHKDYSFNICKKNRIWPIVGGCTSFAGNFFSEKYIDIGNRIKDLLNGEKYTGLFDIELFEANGKIYLNEINWRNSGVDFCCLGTGVYYPYIWYLDMIGEDTSSCKHFCDDSQQFCMDESTDLRHVVFNGLSIKEWNRDRKKTKSFSLWYKNDLKPTFSRYVELLFSLIFKKYKG